MKITVSSIIGVAKKHRASRMRLFGPLNVTILAHLVYIINDEAQEFMSIDKPYKGLRSKFGYKILEFKL